MELELIRTYFAEATNGSLMHGDMLICSCIELPWRENRHQMSCVPEGRYVLVKRYSDHFQWHFELLDVPDRDLILIHPANDAMLELKGCIAPVTSLVGVGKGVQSRMAFQRLKELTYPVFDSEEIVYITLKNKSNEYHSKGEIAHAGIF